MLMNVNIWLLYIYFIAPYCLGEKVGDKNDMN